MICRCDVLMKNKDLWKEGYLTPDHYVFGGDTRGNAWEWLTCLKCGKQQTQVLVHNENR